MKRFPKKAFAAVALFAASGAVMAGGITGNIGFTSDYLFRGISQTDEHPAVQGGLDYAHDSGLFAGVWASTVDFNDGTASTEIDLYGGVAHTLENGVGLKLSGIYYTYPGGPDDPQFDYGEVGPAISIPIMGATLTGTLLYSPDFFLESGDSLYSELGLAVPVGRFTLGGTYGHQDIDENAVFGTPDYDNWSVYVSTLLAGISFKLGYQDTDLSKAECFGGLEWCEGRAVFSLSKSL